VLLLVGCGKNRPTCPEGELDCLANASSINDFDTFDDSSKRDPLTTLTVDLPQTVSADLSLEVIGDLNFDRASDGQLLFFNWEDANGCRPSFCMSHCPRGVRCVGGARCSPSRQDGLTSSITQHWVEYAADPKTDENFDLVVTPASADGCPTDVAALLEAADSTVELGPPVVIPVHLPAQGGGGDGDGNDPICGSGLHCSTLSCTPLGSGGSPDTCVSEEEYRAVFGTDLPDSCAPSGATGCMDTMKGALVKPCCPGLTCKVGSACGGGTAVGGACL
jgi:hypothetical protein